MLNISLGGKKSKGSLKCKLYIKLDVEYYLL